MKQRSGRKWNVWIPRRVWDEVVFGVLPDATLPYQPTLAELVRARVEDAMHRIGYVYLKGRWSHRDELEHALKAAAEAPR